MFLYEKLLLLDYEGIASLMMEILNSTIPRITSRHLVQHHGTRFPCYSAKMPSPTKETVCNYSDNGDAYAIRCAYSEIDRGQLNKMRSGLTKLGKHINYNATQYN